MTNFLEETIESIKDSNHKETDVMFVGSFDGKYRMTWEKFKKEANFHYYSGFGAQEIARDLIVCFFDGSYLDRHEYDGSEWWTYHGLMTFKEDDEYKDFNILGGENYMWCSVEEMNK